MFKLHIASTVAALLLVGCAFDTEAPPNGPVTESLYERLGTREQFALVEPSEVGVAAYDQQGDEVPCVQPAVVGGDAIARTTEDALIIVERLDIHLSDVVLKPGVVHPDEPLHLTDVRLRLGTQLVVKPYWSGDWMMAAGTGQADLLMDWAILTDDGDVLPLATQKLRDVEFEVRARQRSDGRVEVDVETLVPGTLWDFSAVEVADLDMRIFARTDAAVID